LGKITQNTKITVTGCPKVKKITHRRSAEAQGAREAEAVGVLAM
jgi:hypothetical protein